MIIEINRSTIDGIKNRFLHFGFLKSPLTDKEIVRILADGLSLEDAYGIGCDLYCEQFEGIDEALDYYKQAKGA